MVLAATHVHLDHHYCLEVIIMKGRGKEIQAVADGMLALRGVELGKLVLTTSGSSLKQARTRTPIAPGLACFWKSCYRFEGRSFRPATPPLSAIRIRCR